MTLHLGPRPTFCTGSAEFQAAAGGSAREHVPAPKEHSSRRDNPEISFTKKPKTSTPCFAELMFCWHIVTVCLCLRVCVASASLCSRESPPQEELHTVRNSRGTFQSPSCRPHVYNGCATVAFRSFESCYEEDNTSESEPAQNPSYRPYVSECGVRPQPPRSLSSCASLLK